MQVWDFGFLMCIKNVVLMVQCDQIGLVYFGRVIGFCCNVYACESLPEPAILAQARHAGACVLYFARVSRPGDVVWSWAIGHLA